MLNFKNYSIKLKLVIVFIIFKVLPLILLAAIGISSFMEIDTLLKRNSTSIIKRSQLSLEKTTNTAILQSIKALDSKSKSNLEYETVLIANQIAHFLKDIDADILFLSQLNINQKTLESFYTQKKRAVYLPLKYNYDSTNDKWIAEKVDTLKRTSLQTKFTENANEFHKVRKQNNNKEIIPIYKEVSFYKPNGKERYKISSIDSNLKDISHKKSTYLNAESYFKEAKKLKNGEIYVSKVIGEYIPSPVIGSFTKEKATKAGIEFQAQNYAYAGRENPVGKKFEAIIRFVTPVYKNSKLLGYLTLALDHHHIMDFTDYADPLSPKILDIPDASNGNYAFMWDKDFSCISHPRDYFIVGYDARTGRRVPGWIDTTMAKKFKESNESNLYTFLQKQPIFFEQSLDKKPNLEQIKSGELGLDCKYLNFAPQCQGWSQLVDDGGYGSFIIYWSNVWKLTTAASIPYYTGQYGTSERGFGFVTIGANVDEFHSVATKTKEDIDKIFEKENSNIKNGIHAISNEIYKNITAQINKMTIITIILIIVVIYVAILIANSISRRINKVLIGTQKLKENNFDYKIKSNSNDELGQLALSFNEMSDSISNLNKGLKEQLYTDDLTGLHNRNALYTDIVMDGVKTLILLDIDSFKNINDYYGSNAGNFILKKLSLALKSFAQERKMQLYRIGSDEFILLKNQEYSKEHIEKIIFDLNSNISSLHFIEDELHLDTTISFACGVSLGEKNLISSADLALNEAKKTKSLFMIYDSKNPNMNRHTEYILWREKIEYAIKEDNFVPYFQPIINMKNPENKKYECLIRMIDNENIISPYMFLNIAKESKLYPQLTKIMIEKSFKTFQNIDASFSINISIDDIQNRETVTFILDSLEKYNVHDKLIFEILETEEIDNFEAVLPFIEKMKELNVRFAIDDFGSGYSNFSYMLQIRPEFLKIDGSLIKNIRPDSNEYHVVDAIVKFAKSLDIKLIAEYVSTKEILETLSDFNIDYMQGYYFSEPQENVHS